MVKHEKEGLLKPEEIESTHTTTDGLVVLKTSLDEKVVDWQTPERTLAKGPYQLNLKRE
jgi:hypothetical protein